MGNADPGDRGSRQNDRNTGQRDQRYPFCFNVRGGRSWAGIPNKAGAMNSANANAGSMEMAGAQGSMATSTPAIASMVG